MLSATRLPHPVVLCSVSEESTELWAQQLPHGAHHHCLKVWQTNYVFWQQSSWNEQSELQREHETVFIASDNILDWKQNF